jgi:membrane-bound serine protease (ClpP class)
MRVFSQRLVLLFLLAGLAGGGAVSSVRGEPASAARSAAAGPPAAPARVARPLQRVMIIPIRDEIAEPTLYVLRRGLKQAVADHADAVVLDLKTPGGAIAVTLEMMAALEKFPGRTFAYVDNEAMSAGAFLSAVCGEIWFAPDGVIGAAAPVLEGGQEVEATMKLKLVSYLKARIRAISAGKGRRGEVISAMIDAETELRIDGQLIKPKGELLSLTAAEAMRTYGAPPRPLLGAGTARDVDDLLGQLYGPHGYAATRLESTWSEHLAVLLNRAAPVLMGLGLLALFVGFKSPGFGGMIVAGAALLGVVFVGGQVAGLSGHEPVILFAGGLVLLLLELAFWHSAGLLGVLGFGAMLGSLLWSMTDLWPGEPIAVAWSADAFVGPVVNLSLGLVLAAGLAAALLRWLPRGWTWDRLVVEATIGGAAQTSSAGPGAGGELDALVGRRGRAATALRPGGQVEIGGRRFEAAVAVGAVDAGAAVVVVRRTDFALVVEEVAS